LSKTASHAQKATQYFKIQACGATKWSRMPGFLEYLILHANACTLLRFMVEYRQMLRPIATDTYDFPSLRRDFCTLWH